MNKKKKSKLVYKSVDGYHAFFKHIYLVDSWYPDAKKYHACHKFGVDCEEPDDKEIKLIKK